MFKKNIDFWKKDYQLFYPIHLYGGQLIHENIKCKSKEKHFSVPQLAQRAKANGDVGTPGLSVVLLAVAVQVCGKEHASVFPEPEIPDLNLSSVPARISKKIQLVHSFRVRIFIVRMVMSTCPGMSMLL